MADEKNGNDAQTVNSANAGKNIKYEIINTCWWNKTLWHEGNIAELPANLNPPKEHFQEL